MKIQAVVSGMVAIVLVGSAVSAQTLADIAKKEADRRKAVKTTSKVYTNDDLRGYPSPAPGQAPTAAPTPVAAPDSGTPAATEKPKPVEPTEQKDEAYWKGLISEARSKVERSQAHLEAMQSRVNALTTDFYSRDDPAQRGVLWTERTKALQEMDLLRKEIDEQTQAITKIQEDARKAGVPPGWLR